MEAAVHGDIDLFKQALMLDPLTAAVCNPNEIWQLGDDLISATAKWLPQYDRKVVNAARRRLKKDPPTYKKALKGIRVESAVAEDMHKLLERAGTGKGRE